VRAEGHDVRYYKFCPELPALRPRRIRCQQITAQQTFRPMSLSTSEPRKRCVSSGTDRMDSLACIRRAAIDVLTVLHELEESMCVSLLDDAYDASSDRSTIARCVPLQNYPMPLPTHLFLSWPCASVVGASLSSYIPPAPTSPKVGFSTPIANVPINCTSTYMYQLL
jgi:hypothetical protein